MMIFELLRLIKTELWQLFAGNAKTVRNNNSSRFVFRNVKNFYWGRREFPATRPKTILLVDCSTGKKCSNCAVSLGLGSTLRSCSPPDNPLEEWSQTFSWKRAEWWVRWACGFAEETLEIYLYTLFTLKLVLFPERWRTQFPYFLSTLCGKSPKHKIWTIFLCPLIYQRQNCI